MAKFLRYDVPQRNIIFCILAFINTFAPTGTFQFTPNCFKRARIVGGTKIDIEDAPYQAVLRLHGITFCGAIVIHRDAVLTAAHCIKAPADRMTVRVGASDSENSGLDHQAVRVVTHELYDHGPPNRYDIALVFVRPRFVFSLFVAPIDAVPVQPAAGTKAVITGYGALETRGEPSLSLLKADVVIVDMESCNRSYNGSLGPYHICAGVPDGGKDACQGDSGGPLVVEGLLAGITSYGKGCGQAEFPGVYTNIPSFVRWVRDKVAPRSGPTPAIFYRRQQQPHVILDYLYHG